MSLHSSVLILGIQIAIIILNSMLVIMNACCYIYIYVFIWKRELDKEHTIVIKGRKSQLRKIAGRLSMITVSNIISWIPILVVQIIILCELSVSTRLYL